MECDDHVQRALEIASQMLDFANTDRTECDHDGCLLLDGIVRDCAMRIRQEALRWRHERQTAEIYTELRNLREQRH